VAPAVPYGGTEGSNPSSGESHTNSIIPPSRHPADPAIPAAGGVLHKVREVVFDLLRSFGMTTIFGNPGSTELPMFRDFPADFSYVLGLQEMVAIGMADGCLLGR
jgi:hypothetical protein